MKRDLIDIGEFRNGWRVLLAAFVGNVTGAPALLFFGLSSFMTPLQAEFGWSRTEIGVGLTCYTVGIILTVPIIGRLCDHFGARRIALTSIPLLAISLMSLSALPDNLWVFYTIYVLCTVLGAGTVGLTYISAVSPYFNYNRGLAFGLTLSGAGLSAFILPIMLHAVIAAFGWRAAWLAMAAMALVQLPIVLSLIPGGESRQRRAAASDTGVGDSTRAAVLSPRFWAICTPFFLIALTVSGLIVNMLPLLTDKGIDSAVAAKIASSIGIGVIAARIGIGYLVDLFDPRRVSVGVFAVAAAGCLLLMQDYPYAAAVGAFLFGFTVGAEYDLLAYITSRYFGLRYHGAIFGIALSLFHLGAMFSPVFVGLLFDQASNYSHALQVTIVFCALAAGSISTIGPVRYPESGATVSGKSIQST